MLGRKRLRMRWRPLVPFGHIACQQYVQLHSIVFQQLLAYQDPTSYLARFSFSATLEVSSVGSVIR